LSRGPKTLVELQGRLGAYAPPLAARAERILRRIGSAAGLGARHELSVLLCDGPIIRRLNRRWRHMDKPTDVLAFPLHELRPGAAPPPGPLGDIVLALPVARRQAAALHLPWDAHFAHLLTHGLLHLLGYDHATSAQDRAMKREEQRLLRLL
jgi:probable rRNA maturation factor